MLAQLSPLYTSIFVSSMLFPALASIFKEKIFTEAKQKLGGKQLDLFVVNSFGSGAQAVCVFLLLPFLASLRGISFSELPAYLTEGAPSPWGAAAARRQRSFPCGTCGFCMSCFRAACLCIDTIV